MTLTKTMLIAFIAVWLFATETALSAANAKNWNNAFTNSQLFDKKINLNGRCIDKNKTMPWRKIWSSGADKTVYITAVGVLVDTKMPTISKPGWIVGVRIIPYVVSKKQNKKLFLIPEKLFDGRKPFDEFYPICLPKDNPKVRTPTHLKYYPLVLLGVDGEKEFSLLEKQLKRQHKNPVEFTDSIETTSVRTIGELLGKVFSQKRAKFLEGLPFNVRVELIDENNVIQQSPTRFTVNRVENSSLIAHYCVPAQTNRKPQSELEYDKYCLDEPVEKGDVKAENNHPEKQRNNQDNALFNQENVELADDSGNDSGNQKASIQTLNDAEPQPEIEKLEQTVKALQHENELLLRQLNGQPSGHHRLIVISLTQNLQSQEKVIRETLIKVFSHLKASEIKTPFTLLTIQAGRRLNESFLTSDDLPDLGIEGEEVSIRGKVEKGLRFAATDLRALNDLGLVDTIIRKRQDKGDSEAIGSVLYLTDNAGISPQKQNIPNQQRGVPLVWRTDGITLNVLTTEEEINEQETSGCQVWKYAGVGDKHCTYWGGDADTLTKALEVFLDISQ